MAGFRAYTEIPLNNASAASLSAEDSWHLVKVLRARTGDEVTLFDGRGNEARCTLVLADPKAARASVKSLQHTPKPTPRIILGAVMPKGKTMDDIIQSAVEIGCFAVHPLDSTRCECRLDERKAALKHEHWKAVARASAKQSGNPWIPEIALPVPLSHWLEKRLWQEAPSAQNPWFGTLCSLEPHSIPLAVAVRQALDQKPQPETLVGLVGPEGDFTPAEYLKAAQAGFQAVRLGKPVLRCETAVAYLLSVLDSCVQGIPATSGQRTP